MFLKSLLFSILIFTCANFAFSQYVETAANNPKIIDGMYSDSKGNIYTTSGGLQGGFTIGVFREGENYNPNFATGFNGPINIGQVHDSLLVVTNYDNNSLKTYNLNSGETQTVATGLNGPAGLAVDPFNNTFFSNFGAPPAYNGHTIYKYSASGELSLYIDSPLILRPQGMVFDHLGNLYVTSVTDASNNGKIYKVNAADSTLSLLATIGTYIGNLAYRQKDSSIYFPALNRIIKLDLQGNAEVIAGSTSPGDQDGPLATARFRNPLGVAFSVSEDTLYISEAGGVGRLRRMVLAVPTSTKNAAPEVLKVFPNPAKNQIIFDLPIPPESLCSIYNQFGQLVKKINLLSAHSRQVIPIDELSSGTYFYWVETNNGATYSGRFIKL